MKTKSNVPDDFSARELTLALGGKWMGAQGQARCPVQGHEDRNPSLSISDGETVRTVVKCFGGCSQVDVLNALRDRGLWSSFDPRGTPPRNRPNRKPVERPNPNHANALRIWNASHDIGDTLAEAYLHQRNLWSTSTPCLRFHPSLDHPLTRCAHPALIVAAFDFHNQIQAIQRVYLDETIPKKSRKLCLGSVTGAAFKIGRDPATIAITEGVEDAIAFHQMTGVQTWATFGTSNMLNQTIPFGTQMVVIAPDGDAAGDEVVKKAHDAYPRFDVTFFQPKQGDWNDNYTSFLECS